MRPIILNIVLTTILVMIFAIAFLIAQNHQLKKQLEVQKNQDSPNIGNA